MNTFERCLFAAACLAAIFGTGLYAYKNIDAGCTGIPFVGRACGVVVAK